MARGKRARAPCRIRKTPFSPENLTGLARLLRAYAGASFENIALWHERDISHSSVERVSIPDATILSDFMLARCTRLIDGLVVKPERMMQNLERTGGLCFSEAVLLSLVRAGLPRQEAYVMVQRCAMAAHAGEGTFRDNLGADADIKTYLSAQQLDDAFDLQHHLRHVDTIMSRAFS